MDDCKTFIESVIASYLLFCQFCFCWGGRCMHESVDDILDVALVLIPALYKDRATSRKSVLATQRLSTLDAFGMKE